ncbi:hypothetical protein CFC21_011461 [Triticum aestivum]|uniref:Uncharacterized protein n=2 Tax=Triticum aestivum TaxID=4565 RepID=A0A3B5ZUP7_WHEAT|nr:hypothetical protein CFC21_011461 [Triticum aestivum]
MEQDSQKWSMLLHLNQWAPLAYFGMAYSSQISLCDCTVHTNDSVQCWVLGVSASISTDAWLSLRFLGTDCRLIDTGTHAGRWIYLDFSNIGFQGRQSYSCSILHLMAEAEYFAHWNIIYKFYREALTLARELWHTYQFRFFSVTLVLVQWHNMLLAHGSVLCTMHKRVLQIVEELRDLIPTILLRNNGSKNSVAELTYSTSIWNREGCNFVIWMTPINEESTSTVIPPVRSYFNEFASSRSLMHSVHAFSYSMPSATTLKWATKFEALILGKLSQIFCLQLVQLKHRWPFSVEAMSTQQLLFRMKTSTESVTLLKIYSIMFQDWIAHFLGSTSASGYHLGQLWDPGGLAINLCSTRALTFPIQYLIEFWSACVLYVCTQMRLEKPMTRDELNQWMAIIFFLGTLRFDCSLDTLLVLLGFLPPFCCQSSKSMRSGKICVFGASDDLGSFMVVQGDYWFSASNQENSREGFHQCRCPLHARHRRPQVYLGLDQVPHGSASATTASPSSFKSTSIIATSMTNTTKNLT